MSKTMPFTEARSVLSELLDKIERVHEHVVITRNGRPSAVMMSHDADLAASQDDVDAGRVFELEHVKRARRRG